MDAVVCEIADDAMGLVSLLDLGALSGFVTGESHPLVDPQFRRGCTKKTAAQRDQLFGQDAAHRTDHHLVGMVVVPDKAENIFPAETANTLKASQNIPRDGVTIENQFVKIIKDQFRRGVLVRIDLFRYHLLLPFKFFFGEGTVEEDIAQQFGGPWIILRQKGGEECRLFLGGISIEFAAHILHAAEDMIGFSFLGSLENTMLDEMGDTMFFGSLVAGAGIEEYPEIADRTVAVLVDQTDPVCKGMCKIFLTDHGNFQRAQR